LEGVNSSGELSVCGRCVLRLANLYTICEVTRRTFTGDYNQNGVVDEVDYVVWSKGLGTIYMQCDFDV